MTERCSCWRRAGAARVRRARRPASPGRRRHQGGPKIDEVATALRVRRATVSEWESGKTEPRPPERDAYARLLDKLAELHPAPTDAAGPAPAAATSLPGPVAAPSRKVAAEVPAAFTGAPPAPVAKARVPSPGQGPEAAAEAAPVNTLPHPCCSGDRVGSGACHQEHVAVAPPGCAEGCPGRCTGGRRPALRVTQVTQARWHGAAQTRGGGSGAMCDLGVLVTAEAVARRRR
ncbi:helix-turn-helix domain-containing protein [Streptomyces tamarix]|uniref:helix-turn-helix domain-containing protein n=1 Tax=Streptomyces tamarix TaxID=3078565 RepID=UPI0037042AF9